VPVDLAELQASISEGGLHWTADETIHSALSEAQLQNRLGAVPPEGVSLESREEVARAAHADEADAAAAAAPPAWDWRAPKGALFSNYVTPVRDQGQCGSCVAFGTIAAFEAQVQIHLNKPHLGVNLSEADLFACYGPTHHAGACPSGGWWPGYSYPGLAAGVVPEACFPYTTAVTSGPGCHRCSAASSELTKCATFTDLHTPAAMKQYISSTGPTTACFTVYQDFMHYSSGIYQHVTGGVVGGHAICIVGYNDPGRYWIAKNSWSSAWGEGGFFRIAYGNCGIDAEMWGPSGAITSAVYH
jgi:C1A family cysteine protease